MGKHPQFAYLVGDPAGHVMFHRCVQCSFLCCSHTHTHIIMIPVLAALALVVCLPIWWTKWDHVKFQERGAKVLQEGEAEAGFQGLGGKDGGAGGRDRDWG